MKSELWKRPLDYSLRKAEEVLSTKGIQVARDYMPKISQPLREGCSPTGRLAHFERGNTSKEERATLSAVRIVR